jgi:hypothetical protein
MARRAYLLKVSFGGAGVWISGIYGGVVFNFYRFFLNHGVQIDQVAVDKCPDGKNMGIWGYIDVWSMGIWGDNGRIMPVCQNHLGASFRGPLAVGGEY